MMMSAGSCQESKMADLVTREAEMDAEGVCKSEKHISNVRTDSIVSTKKERSLFLLLRIGSSNVNSLVHFLMTTAILCHLLGGSCVMAQNQYGGGLIEQKFAMEPQDQTAIVGSRVTLPCRVIGKSGVLQWTKDDFGLGAHRNLSGYERYSMIGSDEEGDFSLDIYPVHLDDDAKYQCQVSPGPQGQPPIRSKFAVVSVLVPPDPPKIVQGPILLTTEDREVDIECISVGGKPAAEITWIDGDGVVINGKVIYTVEPMTDGRRFMARSVLRLTPKKKHHDAVFTCQAQNTADRTFRAATITIQVKYAPVVSVRILSGAATNGRIPEGAEVRLGCKAEANPNDLAYKWYLNDEVVIGDYTTEMILFNVSRKLHDSIVKCEVHNPVGKSEESETLDVTYGPKFRNQPSSIEADLGSIVTLSCDLDGNPSPEIVWYHEDQDRWSVVGSTPNLTLTVDTSTAGKYNCKASVQGFPEIEAEAVIFLKGPPSILSHRTQLGVQGDNVRVECLAMVIPRPTSIAWYFNSKEINTLTDHDYSIHEELLPDGIKSTLIIRESQSKHYGTYNCSVTNEYGTDMVEINLMPQSSLPLLMICFGVVSATIVIVALIMILILCQKKKRKTTMSGESKKPDVMADIDKASADKHSRDSDRSSYISDLKLDIKNVDGRCNPEYSNQDYPSGLPLAGPVALPADRTALLMQYPRYSNDYTDHSFPPNLEYKEGHNNNGYSGYFDYNREYSPPPLPLHLPTLTTMSTHPANKVQLPSLQSNNQLNAHLNQLNSHLSSMNATGDSMSGSLPRSVDTASTVQFNSGNTSQNNSLQRATLSNKLSDDNSDAINSIGLPSIQNGRLLNGSHTIGSVPYDSSYNLKQNNILTPNGIDIRYSATYGNAYLRSAGGINTVNTANPAATPAPPPYNSIRNSMIGLGQVGSSSHISSPAGSSISGVTMNVGSSSPAQPQTASNRPVPQSPSSLYILPPTSHSNGQLVQLTKKSGGTQPALATHV